MQVSDISRDMRSEENGWVCSANHDAETCILGLDSSRDVNDLVISLA